MKKITKSIELFCIFGLMLIMVQGVSALGPTPISFGETTTGIIGIIRQTDTYTFTATAGDTIYTRMTSSWAGGPANKTCTLRTGR